MDAPALLAAIREQPNEATPRLMYADWLDEHRTDDQARATAEFVRVSNRPGKVSTTMPRTAYLWLEDNWRRLVPQTLALHQPHALGQRVVRHGAGPRIVAPGDEGVLWSRHGRKVLTRINLTNNRRPVLLGETTTGGALCVFYNYPCTLWFTFDRGFVSEFFIRSRWGVQIVAPVLTAEQPLVVAGYASAPPPTSVEV